MKVYNYLIKQGCYPAIMKKNDKGSFYSQIFYFKENPKLQIPKSLVINSDTGTFLGYGFCGESGLKNPDVINLPPNFTPYDINEKYIKDKGMYTQIKQSSLVNWRDKDFTCKQGDRYFINDYDFFLEEDWRDAFAYFDKTFDFVHPLEPRKEDLQFLVEHSNYGRFTRIRLPKVFEKHELDFCGSIKQGLFTDTELTEEEIFAQYLLLKNTGNQVPYHSFNHSQSLLTKWCNSVTTESFVNFCGDNWKQSEWLNFKYYRLLYQNPTTISYSELKEELFTFK